MKILIRNSQNKQLWVITNLTDAFSNFANAPKKDEKFLSYVMLGGIFLVSRARIHTNLLSALY